MRYFVKMNGNYLDYFPIPSDMGRDEINKLQNTKKHLKGTKILIAPSGFKSVEKAYKIKIRRIEL